MSATLALEVRPKDDDIYRECSIDQSSISRDGLRCRVIGQAGQEVNGSVSFDNDKQRLICKLPPEVTSLVAAHPSPGLVMVVSCTIMLSCLRSKATHTWWVNI
jgi:hypothetical protein